MLFSILRNSDGRSDRFRIAAMQFGWRDPTPVLSDCKRKLKDLLSGVHRINSPPFREEKGFYYET
jgi:hypothetical protein